MHRILFAALSLSVVGCTKDAAPAPTATPTEVTPPAAPATAASTWVNLDNVKLKLQMPSGSKAEDASGDAPGYTVSPGDYSYTVMVNTVTESYPSSYDAEVAQAKKFTDGFKAFSKNEKTADGWVLEFEGVSSMDKSPLFGVLVRKTVGGKAFECARNESSKAARDAVSKACQSLTAL